MNKKTQNTLVPALRFPEFQDEEGWEEKEIIDIANKKVKWSFTGGPFGSNLKASDYTSTGIRIIQLQNIGDGKFLDDYKIYTSNEKADELLSCNIYSGDLILSKMGDPVGRACLIPGDNQRFVMASDGIRLVVDELKYSKYFVYSLINSDIIREAIEKKATGSTRKRIGLDDLKKILLIVPSLPEQQKIADCLSSLDELIQTESQVLEALKTHKKGLMQQLFPAEGETAPQLRFPEFMDDEEWEEKSLEDVAIFLKGKGISKSDVVQNGKLPCIRYGELYTHYNETIDKVISFTNISSNDLVLSQANDVIIPASGETKEDIATASCVIKSNIALGGDLNIIRSNINGIFLSYYLNNPKKKDIAKLAQGISVVHLYSSQLKKLDINIPKPPEQQKIADCLSSLDEQIATKSQQIEALKVHKKGLMQQLFPTIDN